MNTLSKKFLTWSIWLISLFGGLHCVDTTPTVSAQDTQFLTPPYFGTKSVSVIFDHEYPTRYTQMTPEDIERSLIHRDGYPYSEYVCTGYSGHAGIDYPMVYDYVLAAHGGTVITAGWEQPENRRTGLGLRVEIQITNSNGSNDTYKTRYGHLSTLMVQANQSIAQGVVIAISGNTGNSGGPHLHFQVEKQHIGQNSPKFYPVNPYGWNGEYPDPWENADTGRPASDNLWKNPPSIIPYSTCPVLMYDSGTPIELPTSPQPPLTPDLTNPVRLEIDDLDTRFTTSGGPWGMEACAGFPACFGTTYRYVTRSPIGNGFAMWTPRVHDLVVGEYDVYVYIPNAHASTTLAYYQIYHNNKVHSAGIDQSRFNQGSYTRTWAYLGRYDFHDGTLLFQPQRVLAYNEGEDGQQMAADAVVLVLADGPPTLTLNIAQGSDDASRNPECIFGFAYAEVYLGRCHNDTALVSGFRYANVDIPPLATIARAHLLFTVDGIYTTALQVRFYGEYNPAAATFSSASKPENRQPLTNAWLPWYLPSADVWLSQQIRYSPDVGSVVQEIVNHPDWQQGTSALTFIVQPDPTFAGSHRRVMAYERDQPPPPPPGTFSARLLVWYACPGGPPCPTQ